jgi:hypothetical protein
MNHEAIYKLYPAVVTIDDIEGAFDKDGNKIEIDLSLVNAWNNPNLYKDLRATEYPSIADQLDYIYHNGIDAWKTDMIDPVKAKYPKGAV